MTIYDIDRELAVLIENSTDPETGEINIDQEKYDGLAMERERKIENTVLMLKNIRAEIAGLKAEETALGERRKSKEGLARRLEGLIEYATGGERFETARAAVTFKRKPESVKIEDGCEEQFVDWAKREHSDYLRYKAPELNKTAIKAAIKAGETVPFASLVSGWSMSIK